MNKIAIFLVTLLVAGCTQNGQPDPQVFFDSIHEAGQQAQKEASMPVAFHSPAISDAPEALLTQADNLRRSGNTQQALLVYDTLLSKQPELAAAREGKGLALLAEGSVDDAALVLGEVLKADPTRWKTLNALGVLFSLRGMHKESQQYFTEALKFSPLNPSVMNNQGLAQALNRNINGAVHSLFQASALEPAGSLARKRIDLNLALVYAMAGKLNDARSVAAAYYSGKELNNNMGVYAHLAKDEKMAASYLNMALAEGSVLYEKAWGNLEAIGPGLKKPVASFAPSLLAPTATAPSAERRKARKLKYVSDLPKSASDSEAAGKEDDGGLMSIIGAGAGEE